MKRREFLAGMLGTAAVLTLDPEWLVGEVPEQWTKPGGCLLQMAHPEHFHIHDVIHIPRTGESMLVTAKHDFGVAVMRALGGKAQPIRDQDPVWILGSTEPIVGDTKPAPLSFPGAAFGFEDELLPTVDVIVGHHASF